MKASMLGGAAALALLLAGCGGGSDSGNAAAANVNAPLKPIAAPQGDWREVVSETPEGGFRMGNPDAPVKLVEYASLSCPHCAEFEEQGVPKLRDTYVRSGQVSWEFRTYLLFGSDPGVSMLLHCQGATPFFRLTEELYATQREWEGKLQNLSQEQQQQLQNMPPQQAATALVPLLGLDQFFRQRGMPQARVQACLADRAGLEKVAAIKTLGDKEGVTGTPTFFINGKMAPETASWDKLEPQLRAAIK
ncbi:MAG TPA: thioredoxin domain-containing protein [Allosphingosinicella sp.]|jgi:protein-disulfide isomerase